MVIEDYKQWLFMFKDNNNVPEVTVVLLMFGQLGFRLLEWSRQVLAIPTFPRLETGFFLEKFQTKIDSKPGNKPVPKVQAIQPRTHYLL